MLIEANLSTIACFRAGLIMYPSDRAFSLFLADHMRENHEISPEGSLSIVDTYTFSLLAMLTAVRRGKEQGK